MKVKTSVTLSEKLLREIDEVAGPGCNRSAVIEQATAEWVRRRRRAELDAREAEIFANLTPEALESDVVHYSIDPFELGDDVELLPEVEERLQREEAAARAAG
jgi:predicted transcriptional regulator